MISIFLQVRALKKVLIISIFQQCFGTYISELLIVP